MVQNLLSIFSNVLAPRQNVKFAVHNTTTSNNPFANPFLATSSFYAKNQPVRGGYFAGYYNGKQNIVGSRLFIEV